MTAGAAVTVAAAASGSSIGPGLAVTCDVVVQQDCERVKGATPHFISQRGSGSAKISCLSEQLCC